MTMIRPMIFLAFSLAISPFAALCGPYDPVARINGQVITRYELDQRILFLSALNIPGDLEKDALERLVDERLQSDAARRAGVAVSDGDLLTGMEEFAARSNMDIAGFTEALGNAGISRESFEAFVRTGLAWRRLVRGLFGSRAQIGDAEVDRAVALSSFGNDARVLVSEIFLPTDTPERRAAAERLAEDIGEYNTVSEFAAAARRYSVAPSARQGGQQDWVPVASLPAAYRNRILSLSPGQISDPIPLPNATAIFQLHGIEESGRSEEAPVSVDYARYLIPGGESDAALARAREIAAETDGCGDLYGIALGESEDRLQRDVVATGQLPDEVAEALVIGQEWDGDTRIVLFVRLAEGAVLDDRLRERIRRRIREHASPRHVPAVIAAVADIPRTRSGKIVELAVRDAVHGRPVANVEALENPEALDLFRGLPELGA